MCDMVYIHQCNLDLNLYFRFDTDFFRIHIFLFIDVSLDPSCFIFSFNGILLAREAKRKVHANNAVR